MPAGRPSWEKHRWEKHSLGRRRLGLWILLALTGGGLGPGPSAWGQYHESFESPEVTWQLADRDCAVRVVEHSRTLERAHSGQSCEFVRLFAGTGSFVHWVHPLPASRVIDEWRVSVWVRASRPGLPLMVRVVLPRSRDPRTGGPLKTLLRGTTYDHPGDWQQLALDHPAEGLTSQLPKLRAQFGSDVNPREAYIDLLVVNAYGGAGATDLWVDDVEVTGLVDVAARPIGQGPVMGSGPAEMELGGGAANRQAARPRPLRTGLDGSVLVLGNRPAMLRVVEYQGEPLAVLKELGFNAVCLPQVPTEQEAQEAREQGMYLVAGPPDGPVASVSATIIERIAAWHLGNALGPETLETQRPVAQRLKSVAEEDRRPVLAEPSGQDESYSRVADILLYEPPAPNGSLPLAEYGRWYEQRHRRARAATPFWAAVPTQLDARIAAQIQTLGAEMPVPLPLEPQQIRLAAYHALASGARGLLFRSRSPLNTSDRLTALRARTLQWLNHELELWEPWVSAGTYAGELDTGSPELRGAVLQGARSRLILVLRRGRDQQYVVGPAGRIPLNFEVYGVPETDEVYRVTPRRLQRLPQQRAAGLRIALNDQQLVTAMVVTQDPVTIGYLTRQVERTHRRYDELLSGVASELYAAVVETRQRMLQVEPGAVASADTLEQARVELQHFQRLVEGGGHDRADTFLELGLDQLAAVRYQDWLQAVHSFPAPVASPLCVTYFALPEHYALGQRLRGAPWGPNMLPGGDFENLSVVRDAGWQNAQIDGARATTSVELSVHAPHGGRSSVRIQAWPADTRSALPPSETAPVRIVSPPVPVQRGQLLRIHGWVRVPEPLVDTLDGLQIEDSHGGPALAQRVLQTRDWEAFTLFRAATDTGPLTVTFSLTGYGEVWLDDVTVCAVSGPAP